MIDCRDRVVVVVEPQRCPTMHFCFVDRCRATVQCLQCVAKEIVVSVQVVGLTETAREQSGADESPEYLIAVRSPRHRVADRAAQVAQDGGVEQELAIRLVQIGEHFLNEIVAESVVCPIERRDCWDMTGAETHIPAPGDRHRSHQEASHPPHGSGMQARDDPRRECEPERVGDQMLGLLERAAEVGRPDLEEIPRQTPLRER